MQDEIATLGPGLRSAAPQPLRSAAVLMGGLLAVTGVVGCSAGDSSTDLLEVSSEPEGTEAAPLDSEALEVIRGTEGVEQAAPWFQSFLEVPQDRWPDAGTNPGGIAATPLIPARTPEVVAGSIPNDGLEPDQVVVPHEVEGGTLEDLVGETVTFTYTEVTGPQQGEPAEIELDVVASIDNEDPGADGPQPAYMGSESLWSLMQDAGQVPEGEYSRIIVSLEEGQDPDDVEESLEGEGFAVHSAREA